MLSQALHEAAGEFGRALRQAPVLAAYRAASAELESDAAAQALLADLREYQEALTRLQRSGLTASQGQIDALRLCQDAIRANPTIMAYLRAQNEAQAFLPSVAAEVSGSLGLDYARFAASGSC
jgi:cell fate (sporulation/competence/biofilm development) regulator YlbF (YheA/YmcA/DUF963 family)